MTAGIAEPTPRPPLTVGCSLALAAGFSTSPCVFIFYYNYSYFNSYFDYLDRLGLSLTAIGLASLAASGILGLVAAGLVRGPRFGPAAVGLLAGVSPGAYIGLQATPLISPSAAAAMVMIGVLVGSAVGGAVGHTLGTMAQRGGRRWLWLGSAGLGLALGISTGLSLTSITFTPMVAKAELVDPLVGGAIGLAVGLAAWLGRHSRPWLGRAGLGLAAGCCTGAWAYQEISNSVNGLFDQWTVWTVWLALGGAVGLGWAGRSGVAPLRPAAAGLAVGAYTGAYCGWLACSSGACMGSELAMWGLVGSLTGGVLGVAIGAIGYHTRLGPATLGLAIGAFLGHSAFNNGLYYHYQGSLAAPMLVGAVCVGVLGLTVGWLAGDARHRLTAFGLAMGGCVGAWAGGQVGYYGYYSFDPGDAARGSIVGMTVGGILGLILSLQTGRLRFGTTALGIAVGAFIGVRFGDPDGQHVIRGLVGMTIGGFLGLVICSRAEHAFLARLPRLAAGVFIGAWTGGDVLSEFPTQASPVAISLICMVIGGLIGLAHGSRPIKAGRTVLDLLREARLVRSTRLSRWLISIAAIHAASGTLRDRYTEEFDSTLSMITGRLARLRRLLCAMSILAGALALRTEVEDDEDE